jgi:hypothetical protein
MCPYGTGVRLHFYGLPSKCMSYGFHFSSRYQCCCSHSRQCYGAVRKHPKFLFIPHRTRLLPACLTPDTALPSTLRGSPYSLYSAFPRNSRRRFGSFRKAWNDHCVNSPSRAMPIPCKSLSGTVRPATRVAMTRSTSRSQRSRKRSA